MIRCMGGYRSAITNSSIMVMMTKKMSTTRKTKIYHHHQFYSVQFNQLGITSRAWKSCLWRELSLPSVSSSQQRQQVTTYQLHYQQHFYYTFLFSTKSYSFGTFRCSSRVKKNGITDICDRGSGSNNNDGNGDDNGDGEGYTTTSPQFLLHNVDNLEEYAEYVKQAMELRDYERAIDLLDYLDRFIQDYCDEMELYFSNSNSNGSSHTSTLVSAVIDQSGAIDGDKWSDNPGLLRWKLFVYRNLLLSYFNIADLEQSLLYCDRLLAMESQFKRLDMLDEVFYDVNLAIGTRAQIFAQKMEVKRAIKLENLLIDGRLKKRLNQQLLDAETRVALKKMLLFELAIRGKMYYMIGDFENALKDFNESLSTTCKDPRVLTARARVHMARSDYEEARNDAQSALSSNYSGITNNQAAVILAECAIHEKKHDKAIDICTQCIRYDALDYDAYLVRATARFKLLDYKRAVEDCKRAELIDPDRIVDLYDIYSKSLFHLTRFNEVESLSHRLLKTVVTKAMSSNMLLWAQIQHIYIKFRNLEYHGHYEEALQLFIDHLDELLEQLPEERQLEYVHDKARILIECNLCDEALRVCEHNSEESGNIAVIDTVQHRALAYAHIGCFDFAHEDIEWCEKELSWESSHEPLIKEMKARLYLTQAKICSLQPSRFYEAVAVFHKAHKYAEQSQSHELFVDILANLAKVEHTLGLEDSARQHLESALELCPSHAVYSMWQF